MQPSKPYLRFETRLIEDRNATIEAGRLVEKPIDFVIIQQVGSNDTTEKPAEEWLKTIREHSQRFGNMGSAYPADWIDTFEKMYGMFKNDQELPVEGTPIRTCPVFNRHEIAMIEGTNIRTVEELAAATSEGLGNIGIGALGLKQRAQTYLDAANGAGKVAMENENLKAKIENQEQEMEVMKRQLAELTAALQDKPSRKKSEAA